MGWANGKPLWLFPGFRPKVQMGCGECPGCPGYWSWQQSLGRKFSRLTHLNSNPQRFDFSLRILPLLALWHVLLQHSPRAALMLGSFGLMTSTFCQRQQNISRGLTSSRCHEGSRPRQVFQGHSYVPIDINHPLHSNSLDRLQDQRPAGRSAS